MESPWESFMGKPSVERSVCRQEVATRELNWYQDPYREFCPKCDKVWSLTHLQTNHTEAHILRAPPPNTSCRHNQLWPSLSRSLCRCWYRMKSSLVCLLSPPKLHLSLSPENGSASSSHRLRLLPPLSVLHHFLFPLLGKFMTSLYNCTHDFGNASDSPSLD